MKGFLIFIIAFFSATNPPPATLEDINAHLALANQDLRLATVGYRLQAANAPFCKVKSPNFGWVLHDIRQYGNRTAAKAAFGFEYPVQILGVVPGGPASERGLQSGDAILRISSGPNNVDFSKQPLPDEQKTFGRLAVLIGALEALASQNSQPILIRYERNGLEKEATVQPALTCPGQFQIDARASGLDAGANDIMVSITPAMMDYMPTDDELSVVVAHELSHVLLDHKHREEMAPKQLRTKDVESEADRLSVWLVANAGYDPQAAIRFWTRFGKQHGLGIFSDSSHYRWKRRVKMIEEEIQKMKFTPRLNGLMPPPLLQTIP
jgi:beta-barrel assembly-enhancing protease